MEKLVGVLLVDDDEIDVMNVKRAFKKNNIANPLAVAGNGVEALEYLRSIPNPLDLPRIILLDINMPRMGGIDFLKELRADANLKGISVFVMTTSNEEQDKVNAYNLGVAGYILKPLSIENFITAVATLNNYWSLMEFPD